MDVKRIGVIGAGTMGRGIAQVCAASGFDVVMSDISADAVAGYDRDDALGISATELSVAINDYLSGELDPVVLSEVIDAYLNG